MERIINYDSEAREGLKEGIDILAKAVKSTLGAKGRNVFIADLYGGAPHITKDGVTVAKNVELGNGLAGEGVKLMKQVALNTNEEVGDGTTTSIVLAQAIIEEGMKRIADGANPMAVKRGIDKAVDAICESLTKSAKQVEGDEEFIKQIASISANNDNTIGTIIAEAFKMVGKHGVIKVEESKDSKTSITHIEGLSFDRGYINHYFSDPLKEKTILQDPYYIVTDRIINNMAEFGVDENRQIPLLNNIDSTNRPLVIICDDMETSLLQQFTIRKVKGEFNSMIIKSPEFGERRTDILKDICAVTGAKFVSKEQGIELKDLTIEDLGSSKYIEVAENLSSIIGGNGDLNGIKARVDEIKEKLKHEKEEFAIDVLEQRLAKLTGGVALLNIGAKSEVELKELKDRVEDALNATKAAIEEGVVAGGGIALMQVQYEVEVTDDEAEGSGVIDTILTAPLETIVENAGDKIVEVLDRIIKEDKLDYGYNVKTGTFGNMFDEGILDPVKVTKAALKNAASVAGTLLTTNCAIHNAEVDSGSDAPPQFS
ncbi:MAG: molecular chaperone GroEL [Sphaerochaetaceae bacterium]|nr:molecular chaperone GroEL [Sphaerochaetaceae bacterium]